MAYEQSLVNSCDSTRFYKHVKSKLNYKIWMPQSHCLDRSIFSSKLDVTNILQIFFSKIFAANLIIFLDCH